MRNRSPLLVWLKSRGESLRSISTGTGIPYGTLAPAASGYRALPEARWQEIAEFLKVEVSEIPRPTLFWKSETGARAAV